MIPDMMSDVTVRALDRLRGEGWREASGVSPSGRGFALKLKDGKIQTQESYNAAFVDAVEEECRNGLNLSQN